jgi:hypothetical protein
VILYVGGQTQPQELQTFEEIPFLHVSEGQIQESQETGEGQTQESQEVEEGQTQESQETGKIISRVVKEEWINKVTKLTEKEKGILESLLKEVMESLGLHPSPPEEGVKIVQAPLDPLERYYARLSKEGKIIIRIPRLAETQRPFAEKHRAKARGKIKHELAHAVLIAQFGQQAQKLPRWLSEAIAIYAAEQVPEEFWRRGPYGEFGTERIQSLGELEEITEERFREIRGYAEAAMAAIYIFEMGGTRGGMKGLISKLKEKGPEQWKEALKEMGLPYEELETGVRTWMETTQEELTR